MPGAYFKQLAKDTRAVSKQFRDEPFAVVEKKIVNM